jgi:RNA polymerase sigma factor (sigma-70 family)
LQSHKGDIEPNIIKGCIKGDLKCQEILYRQYYAYGMSISLRYAKNRDEAIEVLNDSFLKVYENIAKYNPDKPFKVWFRQITVNTAIDNYRKTKRMIPTETYENYDRQGAEVSEINHMEVEDILKLIRSIPEYYAMIFNLYEIEGLDHNEIGEKLNITASTSRSNLSRAKKMLRELFETQNYTNYVGVI